MTKKMTRTIGKIGKNEVEDKANLLKLQVEKIKTAYMAGTATSADCQHAEKALEHFLDAQLTGVFEGAIESARKNCPSGQCVVIMTASEFSAWKAYCTAGNFFLPSLDGRRSKSVRRYSCANVRVKCGNFESQDARLEHGKLLVGGLAFSSPADYGRIACPAMSLEQSRLLKCEDVITEIQ
jgi:hypothetical protein